MDYLASLERRPSFYEVIDINHGEKAGLYNQNKKKEDGIFSRKESYVFEEEDPLLTTDLFVIEDFSEKVNEFKSKFYDDEKEELLEEILVKDENLDVVKKINKVNDQRNTKTYSKKSKIKKTNCENNIERETYKKKNNVKFTKIIKKKEKSENLMLMKKKKVSNNKIKLLKKFWGKKSFFHPKIFKIIFLDEDNKNFSEFIDFSKKSGKLQHLNNMNLSIGISDTRYKKI